MFKTEREVPVQRNKGVAVPWGGTAGGRASVRIPRDNGERGGCCKRAADEGGGRWRSGVGDAGRFHERAFFSSCEAPLAPQVRSAG